MARLSHKGVSIASLYELDTNLEKVVSDLGLAKMSTSEMEEIRCKLQIVMGRGYGKLEMSQKLNPDNKRQTKNITATLAVIARHLQEAEQNLRGAETGDQQAHHTEVSLKVIEMLTANPEIRIGAHEYLSDFCARLSTVAHACLVAAKDLGSTKGKAGRKAIGWYNDFTLLLASIAKQNGIRPTVTIDRETGEAQGRFLDITTGFEQLLLQSMRSPSKTARAKRLSRSLAELSKRPRGKSPKKKQGQNRRRGG